MNHCDLGTGQEVKGDALYICQLEIEVHAHREGFFP